jgi:hypothetical protein
VLLLMELAFERRLATVEVFIESLLVFLELFGLVFDIADDALVLFLLVFAEAA